MTAVTPSMVTELSATLVERITLRCEAGATARSCSAGERSPWSGRTSNEARAGNFLDGSGSSADFCRAGKEDQDVAGEAAGEETFESGSNLFFKRRRGVGSVFDAEFVELAFGAQHRAAVQEVSNGRRVERRGHDHQLQGSFMSCLEALEESEGEVGIEMTLVELVQDDGADAFELWIGEKAAGEDAFGQEAQAGAWTAYVFEADLIADGLAELLAEFLRDAASSHAGSQTARFEHKNFAGDVRQERRRDAGGLARPRRSLDDQIRRMRQVRDDVRQQIVDGKLHSAAFTPRRRLEWSPERSLPGGC